MNLKDNILNRIDELLRKEPGQVSLVETGEISLAVTDILEKIYGTCSPQLELVEIVRKQVYENKNTRHADEYFNARLFVQHLHGFLRNLALDIRGGRIANIQSEARGEVLGDFLVLARKALDEEQKNVAAVLACAALEDALKRCASEQGLDVHDQDMSAVVNALKSKKVIRGAQGQVLRGYVRIRNKAFHAEWDAIDVPSVDSIIAFTETFLVQQFSAPIAADSPADPPAEA